MEENEIKNNIPHTPEFGQIKKLKDAKEELDQFMFLMWTSNPNTDRVRVILDDGTVKLILKRDKFYDILNDLLQPRDKQVEYNLYRIKESLNKYGGYFWYDRMKNEFKELSERIDFLNIKPIDYINESRKQITVKESLADSYKELHQDFKNKTKYTNPKPQTLGNKFNRFFNVIRNYSEKPKK